jgi:hypothetical protein
MSTVERHTTPDGKFTISIHSVPGEDMICFDEYKWHTHGDLLSAYQIDPPISTIAQFKEALFVGKLVLVVASKNGGIYDVWVTDDPASDLEHAEDGESLEFRLWNGQPYHAG